LISSILRGWGGWWPFGSSSDSRFFLGRALSFPLLRGFLDSILARSDRPDTTF
jgi:hypothetical protein